MKDYNRMDAAHRQELIAELKADRYDLVVIGGGATGAGIALDAASRGVKTALIEKGDFASGTSSKSTKLIHGGLRYLKQLDFALVRETGTERAIVHRLAPHLVLPEKMILPLVDGGTYGKLATSFGLKVYDILAGVKGEDRRKMLSKKDTLALEPLLNENGLKGSGYYAEYRTDDARLTIELIKTAARHGALPINYIQAEDFIYDDAGRVKGLVCNDQLLGETFHIEAAVVVGAGGPWVDLLRAKDKSLKGKRLHLTKGVHIVVPKEKFPIQNTVYFDVPDGRMLFAVPRGRVTYIGTTDTNYKGNLNRVLTTKKDAEYLIDAVKNAFPTVDLRIEDLVSNWAGLRPLIHEDGKSPSELSRKDEIFDSPSGFIAIAGGKLTGYRKMAQRVVDKVVAKLKQSPDRKYSSCQTKNIGLTKDVFSDFKEVQHFIAKLSAEVEELGLDKFYAWYLTTNYGSAAANILAQMDKNEKPIIALTRAELAYGLQNEMVQKLSDFYNRRTGQLYFETENIKRTFSFVLADMASYLGWDDSSKREAIEIWEQEYQDASQFYEEEAIA